MCASRPTRALPPRRSTQRRQGLGRPARPEHRSAPSPAAAPPEGRAREKTPRLAPQGGRPGSRLRSPGAALPAPAVARASPKPRPLPRGLLSPLQPKRRPGKARSGRYPEGWRGYPGAAAAPHRASEPRWPAGPTAARYLSPAPQPAPLPRAAPARHHRRRASTAFCVPVGVGRSRTKRQTRQPNRHRFYLAPPVQLSAAPIGGPRGGLPSNHKARRAPWRRASPTQRSPRDSAGPGRRRVRASGRALRDAAAEWKRCAVSLFFRRTHGASQEGGGSAGWDDGASAARIPGRGREAARAGWREPTRGRDGALAALGGNRRQPQSSRAGGAGRGR